MTDAQDRRQHISASFGLRTPPYANWNYIAVEFTTASGQTRTARSASSPEPSHRYGSGRVGEYLGFGPYRKEKILEYRLICATYTPDPSGLRIRIKDDAHLLLIGRLNAQRSPQSGFSSFEHESRDWLRENAGRIFSLAEGSPQMSRNQFYNTMPEADAEAGFFLPIGLCDELDAAPRASENAWYPTPLECDECTPGDCYPNEHDPHCKYFDRYFENGPHVPRNPTT